MLCNAILKEFYYHSILVFNSIFIVINSCLTLPRKVMSLLSFVWSRNNSKSRGGILIKFFENVDKGPRSSSLNLSDVPDSAGTLSFDFIKIIPQDQKDEEL